MKIFFRKPYSIRQLLIGQFVLVMLVAVVAAVLMIVFWRIPHIRADAQRQQLRLAAFVLKQIEGELDNAESIMSTLAPLLRKKSLENLNVLYAKGDGALEGSSLNTFLLEILASKGGLYEGIYILDKKMTIKALGVAGDKRSVEKKWIGNDLASLNVLHGALSTQSITWSDHFISPVTGRPVVGVALSAGDAIIFSEVSPTRLAFKALTAGEMHGLFIMVLDSKGEVIAAPDMVYSKHRLNLMGLPIVKAMVTGTPEFGLFDYNGKSYIGTAIKSDRVGWGIVAAYPNEVVKNSFLAPILNTAFIIILSLGSGLYLCFCLSNAMARQFDESIEYARSIMLGKRVALNEGGSVKELEELKTSLSNLSIVIDEQDLHMRSIVDLAPHTAIQLLNQNGRVIDWNSASEKILGFSKAESMGKNFAELLLAPCEIDSFVKMLGDIEATGEPYGPYELDITRKDGERRVFLSNAFMLPTAHGRPVFACMGIDITDFRNQEKNLIDSEQKFNVFFNLTPVTVAVCEHVGERLIYRNVNVAWEKIMRRSRIDVINNDVVSLGIIKNSGSLTNYVDELLDDKKKAQAELVYCRGDGTTFIGRSVAGIVSNGDQKLILFSIIDSGEKLTIEKELEALNRELEAKLGEKNELFLETTTDLRFAIDRMALLGERLASTDKMATVGAMAPVVLDSLKGTLVQGFEYITRSLGQLDEAHEKIVDDAARLEVSTLIKRLQNSSIGIVQDLKIASKLVTLLQDFSINQASEPLKRIKVAELVETIITALEPTLKNSTIELHVAIEKWIELEVQPGSLARVLTLLLSNSISNSEQKFDGMIFITAFVLGDSFSLKIFDNSDQFLEVNTLNVFEINRANIDSLSPPDLRLIVARSITRNTLGGELKLEFPQGGGAEFTVEIPLFQNSPKLAKS